MNRIRCFLIFYLIIILFVNVPTAGNPIKQPRTGWYAQKENANFALEIAPTLETKYITIM